jgi:hypothetical protein
MSDTVATIDIESGLTITFQVSLRPAGMRSYAQELQCSQNCKFSARKKRSAAPLVTSAMAGTMRVVMRQCVCAHPCVQGVSLEVTNTNPGVPKGQKLKLLDNVSGYLEPGKVRVGLW